MMAASRLSKHRRERALAVIDQAENVLAHISWFASVEEPPRALRSWDARLSYTRNALRAAHEQCSKHLAELAEILATTPDPAAEEWLRRQLESLGGSGAER